MWNGAKEVNLKDEVKTFKLEMKRFRVRTSMNRVSESGCITPDSKAEAEVVVDTMKMRSKMLEVTQR